MSNLLFANNATSMVGAPISSTGTVLVLAATTGERFPSPSGSEYFVGSFTDQATGLITEVVHCTARDVDMLTIVRGQEGTAPVSWAAGDFFGNYWTAGQAETLLPAEWSITDGTTTVVNVTELSVTGAVVSQTGTGEAALAIAASGGGGFIPDFVSGGYYQPFGTSFIEVGIESPQPLLFYPMQIPNACIMSSYSFGSQTAGGPDGGGVGFRFAIYGDQNGKPHGVLYDNLNAEEIPASGGSQVSTFSGKNVALPAGTIWIASAVTNVSLIGAQAFVSQNGASTAGPNYSVLLPSSTPTSSLNFANFGYTSSDNPAMSGQLPDVPTGLVINESSNFAGNQLVPVIGIA